MDNISELGILLLHSPLREKETTVMMIMMMMTIRDWEGKTGIWAYDPWVSKVLGHFLKVWAITVMEWARRKETLVFS